MLGVTCKLFNVEALAVKGNGDTSTGWCYQDVNRFIGKCQVQATSTDIVISKTTTIFVGTVNTLTLCKAECDKPEALCTAYDFEGETCKIYAMGVDKVSGSLASL